MDFSSTERSKQSILNILTDKRNATTQIQFVLFMQLFRVIMLQVKNKHYLQYYVLKESQTLCSGTINLVKTNAEI